MKKYSKQIWSKNKVIVFAIVLELLFLLNIVINHIFSEVNNLSIDVREIDCIYADKSAVDENNDGSYTITGLNNTMESNEAWRIQNLELPAGTYVITVQYEAENLGENCYVEIESYNSHNYLDSHTMVLNSSETLCKTMFLLSENVDELKITVYFDEIGKLSIKGIDIEENLISRWGIFLEWLCYFAVGDLLWIFFFSEGLIKVSVKTKIDMLAILLITIFSSIPLFSDVLYAGHDIKYHTDRIACIAEELLNGQLPVRIYHNAKNGYGYVCSLMYGEILVYFPAILHILGLPVFKAYQFYAIIVNFFTCFISYKVFLRMFRKHKIALVGAMLYTCSLYRIVCVYTRAAVGEYTAMMFFPIVLYAIWGILGFEFDEDLKKYKYYLALGMTGIIQSHIISVELMGFFLALICIIHVKRLLSKDVLKQFIQAILITICINLWFLVPFLQNLRGDYKVVNEFPERIDKYGVYFSQIFSVFVSLGQGTPANTPNSIMGDMPLGLGVSLVIGLLLFCICRVIVGKECTSEYVLGKESVLLGSVAIWMASIFFPWYKIEEINRSIARYIYAIQSPTRLLSVASIMITIVTMYAIILYEKKYGINKANIICGVLIGSIILMCGSYYTSYFERHFTREYIHPFPSEMVLDNLYLPGDTNEELLNNRDILHDGEVEVQRYYTEKGISILECTNVKNEDSIIEVPILCYSNYQAIDSNGKQLEIRKGENGRIAIILPAEFSGTIKIQYTVPKLWRICEYISFLSVILLIICMLKKQKGGVGNVRI